MVSFFVVVVAVMLYQLKLSLVEVVTIDMPPADAIVGPPNDTITDTLEYEKES